MSILSVQAQAATSTIVSIPALAAALCTGHENASLAPVENGLQARVLAPMYRLAPGSVTEEAHAAAQLAGEVTERLRRLKRAYGEWQMFEPGPYFDLSPAQVALLTRVSERVSTVHVVFSIDALLPAFQLARAYAARFLPLTGSAEHSDMVYATLASHWRRMLDVVHTARQHLSHDIGFLALNGAAEERARWWPAYRSAAAGDLRPWCVQAPDDLPSLTLTVEFPLPAYRQPGRKRRLRRTWQRLYGFSPGMDKDT
ncbi:hypothetical protein [Caldilinea sp.]|uniref:hypothetical protein n=1 Tax=Caldilinea sp. TaxID=2293560 RepID=UPI002C32676B|nr:hypothetical protein [Anaerolineales bacterium]HQY92280.1 hypothetical protein [Caldilinea sp.]